MPPYTRRSSGWTQNANDTPGRDGSGAPGPNIEYFLEHLEQFKRKHISQNRDIIKSNAFLQLRIRDLESRIQQMDLEKHHDHRLIARLRSDLYEASQHQGSVNGKDIWLELGQRLGFIANEVVHQGSSSSRRRTKQVAASMPSVRISLDPEGLPGGVARAIARAPEEEGIEEEMEDEEMDDTQQEGTHPDQHGMDPAWNPVDVEDSCVPSQLSASPAPSLPQEAQQSPASPASAKISQPRLPSQRVSSSSANQWTSFLPSQRNPEDPRIQSSIKPKKSEAMKGKKIVASGASAQQPSVPSRKVSKQPSDENSSTTSQTARQVFPPTHSEEVRSRSVSESLPMVSEGYAQPALDRSTSTQQQRSSSESRSVATPSEDAQPPPSATTARKRKPSTPRDPVVLSLDTYSDHLDDVSDNPATDEEEPQSNVRGSRSSRRSSVRARPSINYALPKLNTKMRKPDPPTEELRAVTALSAAALAGPTTLIGTGEGDANGDLKDLKRERQMRQGGALTSSAARKSGAPRSTKSRASKGATSRSRLNGDAPSSAAPSESEDEERDGDDERGRGSAVASEVESSADERETERGGEHHSALHASSRRRQRTKSSTPTSYRNSDADDDDDEGEETIVAATVTFPHAGMSAGSEEDEIEVARSSVSGQEGGEEGGETRATKDVTMPLLALASNKRPFTPIAAPDLTFQAGPAAAQPWSVSTAKNTTSVKSLSLASSGPGSGASGRNAIDSASATGRAPLASASINGGSDSVPRPSSSSSSSSGGANRQSFSSLQYKKPTHSGSSSGGLTDADLALLAQSTSSLADLTSTSAWPSTPQVGGGGSLLKAGASGLKGRAGAPLGSAAHKVSTLSRFANHSGSAVGGAGAMIKNGGNAAGGVVVVGGGGQRALGKIKPFNLSASSSLNPASGVSSTSASADSTTTGAVATGNRINGGGGGGGSSSSGFRGRDAVGNKN